MLQAFGGACRCGYSNANGQPSRDAYTSCTTRASPLVRRPRHRCDGLQSTVWCRPDAPGALSSAVICLKQYAVDHIAKQPFANVPYLSQFSSLGECCLLSDRYHTGHFGNCTKIPRGTGCSDPPLVATAQLRSASEISYAETHR